ncbi:MAG: NUDIX domain-containing protein [Deltaproteobacteria bacterium]|nr:NUDIX domain-containing protein [Deltaproteobacteria bacterium]
MPVKVAAGCLVRARFGSEWRYLIVHPSGSYNRRAPYSIPKGLVEAGESAEDTAVRETREETGLACRIVAALGEIAYVRTRKRVIGFLAEPLEPPESPVLAPGDWEIDHAEFLAADEARARLHPDQQPFIDRAIALEPEA